MELKSLTFFKGGGGGGGAGKKGVQKPGLRKGITFLFQHFIGVVKKRSAYLD